MTKKAGKLTVIYGPMFSGKTTELIELSRKKKNVVVFKPNVDIRYTERPVLHTHDGVEANAIKIDINKPEEIWEKFRELKRIKPIETVIVDEVNLFGNELVAVVKRLLKAGVEVIAAGILLDTEKGDFGQTSKLLALADSEKAFYAQCGEPNCTKPAPFTYAKQVKQTQVVVGADDLYGAACEEHYEKLHVMGKSESVQVAIERDTIKQLVSLGVYPAYAEWLRNIDFPYQRQPLPFASNRKPHIEVGGDSFQIGKSTVKEILEQGFKDLDWPVVTADDLFEKNPYYKLREEMENVVQAEKWFLKEKYRQLKKVNPKQVSIVCVTPEMEFGYGVAMVLLGRMSLQQFYNYEDYYKSQHWEKVPAPDLLIYVQTGVKKSEKSRIKQSRQSIGVDDELAAVVKIINQAWLDGPLPQYKVLTVSEMNLKIKAGKQRLFNEVRQQLRDQGWSL